MEEDPFAILEAMVIAGFAVGANTGYVYIRGEYPLATRRIETAAAALRDQGWLGPSVGGSGFPFDVEVRRGGGAYICGEETALMNSIEGRARRTTLQTTLSDRARTVQSTDAHQQRRDSGQRATDRRSRW